MLGRFFHSEHSPVFDSQKNNSLAHRLILVIIFIIWLTYVFTEIKRAFYIKHAGMTPLLLHVQALVAEKNFKIKL